VNDDLRKLQNFRNDVKSEGSYYGTWYVLSSTSAFSLSQRTRNVISSYLGDRGRIDADDFDNIIQIVEMLEE
jgi:hypothetical protein